jgi:hypothetical protein
MKINGADPANISNRVLSEQETRRRILGRARELGCEQDMKTILNKYDRLLRNCTNEQERKAIAQLGVYDMYALLDKGGELYVDGQLVYKDE